jgi:two-component system, LytTR family, sensor kinase
LKNRLIRLINEQSYQKVRPLWHLAFWLLIWFWLFKDTKLSTGFEVPEATYILTAARVFLVITSFYAIAYYILPWFFNRKRIWLALLLLLFLLYGNSQIIAQTYIFIDSHYEMPGFFKRFVKSLNENSWGGLVVNYNIFYIFLQQIATPLSIALAIKIVRDLLQERFKKLQLERDNYNLELNMLKSQINPHFFFNTLNNIYSLIVDKDEVAAGCVIRLSDLMRYTLYESNAPRVALNKEVAFLQDYIEIERIRYSQNYAIEFNTEGVTEEHRIAPLILITFVENAFKHGFRRDKQSGWMRISVSVKGQELTFCVANNRKPEVDSKPGIGLVNVRRRLELLYPREHQLLVKPLEDQFYVELKINLL